MDEVLEVTSWHVRVPEVTEFRTQLQNFARRTKTGRGWIDWAMPTVMSRCTTDAQHRGKVSDPSVSLWHATPRTRTGKIDQLRRGHIGRGNDKLRFLSVFRVRRTLLEEAQLSALRKSEGR